MIRFDFSGAQANRLRQANMIRICELRRESRISYQNVH